MNEQPDAALAARLALAARQLRAQSPPPGLLAGIQAQLPRRGPTLERARPRRLQWLGWGGLGTAFAGLAAWLVIGMPADDALDAQAQAEAAQAWLVATEMSSGKLVALGLPYDPSRAGERMPAQLVLQSSGDLLAVRLAQ
jgi:hypothetical protein